MSEIQFCDNYNDLSTDAGFQFEFHCEHCHERGARLRPVRGRHGREPAGRGGRAVRRDLRRRRATRVGHVRNAGWSKARDKALRDAVEQAKDHFHRCPRCANHFCDNCWNEDEGTCICCVPRLDPELAAISREAKIAKAREVAYETRRR